MRKSAAVVVSLVFAVAVLSPIFRSPPRDSYPLSNYPMFSHRIDAVNDVSAVIGREADGTRRLLSPQIIADSDEVMIALQSVNDAIGGGDRATAALCETVAGRLFDGSGAEIALVEVVTERYDTVAWFRGERDPISARVLASCEVGT